MAKAVWAFAIVIVVLVGTLGVISLAQQSGSSLNSTTISTTTSAPNYPSVSSRSASGLALTLSLNAKTIQVGESISVSVGESNPLPESNNVTSSNNWALKEAGGAHIFSTGPCGTVDYPMGWAIAQGNYVAGNVSSAQWLGLYAPGIYGCPGFLTLSGYLFQPSSDIAGFLPDCDTIRCDYVAISATASFHGYYNGTDTSVTTFAPGVYTVVAGDEWGTLVFLHFTVVNG